ncbi:hypothetical protein DRF67_10465 [Chryseobacterium pennipullorum]|uniref:Uncharacterized protein n=1 Tax=Chryseobacterium pennipullorum TaxID=2258963 RepID=A0A3D9B1E4_9FLAO|nr:hypothetical protein DRF67_10465 [Chryseobacterium pennipullorum]
MAGPFENRLIQKYIFMLYKVPGNYLFFLNNALFKQIISYFENKLKIFTSFLGITGNDASLL